MKKITRVVAVLLTFVLALIVAGCGDYVAKVNGKTISKKDFDRRFAQVQADMKLRGVDLTSTEGQKMLQSLKQQTLDQMINEILISEYGKEKKIEPTKDEITNKINEIRAQFPSPQDFEKALKDRNITDKDLQEMVRVQLINDKIYNEVTKGITVSEQEVKEYYEKHKNEPDFQTPEQRQVRHILIAVNDGNAQNNPHFNINVKRTDAEAKKLAEELIKQIKAGKDFATLAKEKSDDPGVKENGGQYTFSRGEMVKEFEDAAFALKKPGDITETPVKTAFGYHIIKLEKIIPARQKTYEEVKEQLKNYLLEKKKREAYNKFLEDLKKKAKIETKLSFK
ncbi:peptidylprolyl isomerase [Carboxydothermus hydrogenoformans]|uniref:peptidylprolyl isomerase n=1 Tax=Carboxydothermus hydrogenoformans (strain ATCC BAA-161 / DSM 6008 / Z-2901) TaxID=246194 RepID=Q3AFL1_CARHZ|nr:peptidylprolyl isomerase [Carboxydothermus hydrogenoformans]ABB16224.1 putative peptidyl-prolyl cis-trans isomerase, PpiC-type [Carboxydothermus hydrogenoformans Z-2901]